MSTTPHSFSCLTLHYSGFEDVFPGRAQNGCLTKNGPFFGIAVKDAVRVALESGGETWSGDLSAGELLYVPAACVCTVGSAGVPAQFSLIRFRAEPPAGTEAAAPLPGSALPAGAGRFRMPEMLGWLPEFRRTGVNGSSYYLLQSRLYAIAHACLSASADAAEPNAGLDTFVERAQSLLKEQYDQPLDVEALARLSGASPSRFYRSFRSLTGLSPNKFITAARLNASLRLLSAEGASVADAAHAVGYQDELYFSRLFKKNMGLSPSDYAVRARKRVANLSPVLTGDLSVLGIQPVLSLERGWSASPEASLRLIARSRPELILTSPVPDAIIRQLSGIAPVLVLYWKLVSWRERLRQIAEALELKAVAERWLAHFDLKADNAQHHIRRHLGDEPFLLAGITDTGFRVFGIQRGGSGDWFYDGISFIPDFRQHRMAFHDTESLRDVAAYDCPRVVFLVPPGLPEEDCLRLEEDWLALMDGRSGRHCLFIPYEDKLLYNAAVHESMLDRTVRRLLLPSGGASHKNP